MTAHAFDDLVAWLSCIIAPELAHALADGRTGDAVDLLDSLSLQQLYGLAVVLADRCPAKHGRAATLEGRLIRAVHREDQTGVAELLHPLVRPQLHDLCQTLAGKVPQPGLRPDDGQIDELAVHRAAAGEPILLTRPERDLAIQLMNRRGIGPVEIQRRLRVAWGTVCRALYQQPVQLDLLTLIEESPLT